MLFIQIHKDTSQQGQFDLIVRCRLVFIKITLFFTTKISLSQGIVLTSI